MKPDELALLLAVASCPEGNSVRDVIARMGINGKRACYLLGKWAGKGWYEWGVCIDLGWLTPLGQYEARLLSGVSCPPRPEPKSQPRCLKCGAFLDKQTGTICGFPIYAKTCRCPLIVPIRHREN